MKCVCVTFLLILPSPCQASLPSGFHPCLPRQLLLSLVRVKAAFHYTFDYKTITLSTLSADHNDDEDCKDDDDRLWSANIYCFRAELSAEGAKWGVETSPEVFPPDDLPRPSRPKAGLGLVMMMMIKYCFLPVVDHSINRHSYRVFCENLKLLQDKRILTIQFLFRWSLSQKVLFTYYASQIWGFLDPPTPLSLIFIICLTLLVGICPSPFTTIINQPLKLISVPLPSIYGLIGPLKVSRLFFIR